MWFHKLSLFFLVFLILSCTTGADFQDINIKNDHSTTIMVDLWDLESSNTVDPSPAVPVDKTSFVQINSNQSVTLSKGDIKGNNESEQIRLFLYEVRGDSAFYQSSFSLSSYQKINIGHGSNGYFLD